MKGCGKFLVGLLLLTVMVRVNGTPPYGDPNNPYDRLPGTLETYHVKWSKPNATGKLNVLFIIPYVNSREVVETAQRLDLKYTVIMNTSNSYWDEGIPDPDTMALEKTEAIAVMDKLSTERLALTNRYDVIVIAKISWEVIPPKVRERILEHVERGTGLVYVSPNRLKKGYRSKQEVTPPDEQFNKLFKYNCEKGIADEILGSLPVDAMPLYVLKTPADYQDIPGITRWHTYQGSVCVSASSYGKGRILDLDYFDAGYSFVLYNSLSYYYQLSHGFFDQVMYDYAFAILTKAMLWAARKESPLRAGISISSTPTKLTAPVDEELAKKCWENKSPKTVIARNTLPEARVSLSALNKSDKLDSVKFAYDIRDAAGKTLQSQEISATVPAGEKQTREVRLPFLSRGTYFLDLRVLDAQGRVLDFASKSFRVESPDYIKEVTTDKEAYKAGETVSGKVSFNRPLPADVKLETVKAIDTWGRTVALASPVLSKDRLSASFSFPVKYPLSRLWDIVGGIADKSGEIASAKTWISIPNWTFDDYMVMLIFCPTPGVHGWKGFLYGDQVRKYGINAAFTYLIYSNLDQYEHNARHHLQSVSFAEHMGEKDCIPGGAGYRAYEYGDSEKKRTDLAELSRMCRYIADTGKPLDPKKFPYKMGHITADTINSRIKAYQFSAKFGSPFYVLAGENYMLGELRGNENSGFGPTTTKKFQEWCKKQYHNDLNVLNNEWNTKFTSWNQIEGILLQEAEEKDQLPRWVDFRYFMRSEVWTQFFIDWTDMMRRFVPEVKTGRVGHDHYDFTRLRNHLTSSKLYIGQAQNTEWREALVPELLQSFSGDKSFLLASQCMRIWGYDIGDPVNRRRWPWLALFMGLRGFDWEEGGMLSPSLGGYCCFTPDFSESLPFLKEMSEEIRAVQRGIGKLVINSKPYRSKVAMLWSPYNHYISRLLPFQKNAFSGTSIYNVSVTGGAPSDALALLNSIRIRPTVVGPQDVIADNLEKRGFKALVLPYNKGMSEAEAEAIKQFVRDGGLLIADNDPGTYSQHGKELKVRRLKELFPDLKKKTVVNYGKGHAAYLPDELNGYESRFEKCDYRGSDSVASLLKNYAGIEPPMELISSKGLARRDVFMPVFMNGSATLVGLLRCVDPKAKEVDVITVDFKHKYYVWDVMNKKFCGDTDKLSVRLDLYPKLFALMPAKPVAMSAKMRNSSIKPGEAAVVEGKVAFEPDSKAADDVGQAVHVRVVSPDKKELEFFAQNVLFKGRSFTATLPVSYSAEKGHYTVEIEDAVTGMKAETAFNVN